MLVKYPDITPPSSVDKVGLALSGDENQCHVGIIYRPLGETSTCLLHLAWHYYLKNEHNISSDYVWIDLPIDDVNKTIIAQYCKHIAEKNSDGKIPYGFNINGKFFDEAGSWIGEEGVGLTCATFVLAVFRELALPLLRTQEWPSREDDKIWQEKILSDLLRYGASREHVERQKQNVGGARFRPTEVVGAATSEDTPIGYDEATRLASIVLSALCEYNKRRDKSLS